MIRLILLGMVSVAILNLVARGSEEAWPAQVPGWVAPVAGEHPRLLFRKSDIPALKERLKTPEGQAIIAKLRETLGNGGEALPTEFNTRAAANTLSGGDGSLQKEPAGMFTFSHGAGYGFLYVLTGEKKYADLAKQCTQKVLDGQLDRDERYSWKKPGTGFRKGAVHMGLALAYDLCYDAWDEDFRKLIVKEIQTGSEPDLQHKKPLTLETMVKANGYPPGSNHFGAYIGGTGMAMLAIQGDPGADDVRLKKVLTELDQAYVTVMTKGFGDHGWFAEGTHTGRIAANTGLLPLAIAFKNAAGKDYITPRPNVPYMILRLASEIVPIKGKPYLLSRGPYGDTDLYGRAPMLSHSSDFAIGLGAVSPDQALGLLWVYNHFVEPGTQKNYDVFTYPHQAIFAYVFWPVGKSEKNPGDVWTKTFEDKISGYYFFRNEWKDENDIVVTGLNGTGPRGYHHVGARPLLVWGMGEQTTFGELNGTTSFYLGAKDGSGVVTCGGTSLAVDYSSAAGVEALLVMTGPGAKPGKAGSKSKCATVTLGTQTVHLMMFSSKGNFPEAKVESDRLLIGGQTLSLSGGNWVLEKFLK